MFVVFLLFLMFAFFTPDLLKAQENLPHYPTGVAIGMENELIIICKGKKTVDIYSLFPSVKLLRSCKVDEIPTGICAGDGKAYVTVSGKQAALLIISLESGILEGRIPLGAGACNPCMGKDENRVYVCNRYENTVSEVDTEQQKVLRTAKVLREPVAAVLSKDGCYLYVNNLLPVQRADSVYVSASVSVIETRTFAKIKDIGLANGSNALRGICSSPDGKFLYVSHNLGRYAVPTSQLNQGWMNTSVLSIIDADAQEYMGSVLLDEPERGAAGIWDIICDEEHIWVSHSGTHEVSVISRKGLMDKFLKCTDKFRLEYDLGFLYGLRKRVRLSGNGPRAMASAGDRLYIPTYFADVLNILDKHSGELTSVDLNPNREERDIDKGERLFNDADKCFQNWQSCNGCHPGDGRADGMNWDLLNDGVGNPKNCKSLVFSHVTSPSMISGIREHAEQAVRAGFNFIQFYDISEEDAECIDAYLKSLLPVPSPYLVNGNLSAKAQEGKKVFEKYGCGECHSGIYYTDREMHRIGKKIEFEKGWDTPTLREVWRTAPYLYDGRAATIYEVFSVYHHGIGSKISKKEIEALAEYVNSL